jgi:hypothetical protein
MRHCVKATGALLAGAMRDREHARGAAEAIRRLPTVLTERRPLPANVEQSLALLESR